MSCPPTAKMEGQGQVSAWSQVTKEVQKRDSATCFPKVHPLQEAAQGPSSQLLVHLYSSISQGLETCQCFTHSSVGHLLRVHTMLSYVRILLPLCLIQRFLQFVPRNKALIFVCLLICFLFLIEIYKQLCILDHISLSFSNFVF